MLMIAKNDRYESTPGDALVVFIQGKPEGRQSRQNKRFMHIYIKVLKNAMRAPK